MELLHKISSLFSDFISLFFPRLCAACETTLMKSEEVLCLNCLHDLPLAVFNGTDDSPLDKIFWGRVNARKTFALFLFSKKGKVQHLIHQLKYKNRPDVGVYLGKMLAKHLNELYPGQFDVVVPVPLHKDKERKRGYNQSAMIAQGIAEVLNIPVGDTNFIKVTYTETQTRKARFARYENVKETFKVVDSDVFAGKHLLLVDDVITTGATLESCAAKLLDVPEAKVSIACLAFASK
jgi:ComF family protein